MEWPHHKDETETHGMSPGNGISCHRMSRLPMATEEEVLADDLEPSAFDRPRGFPTPPAMSPVVDDIPLFDGFEPFGGPP